QNLAAQRQNRLETTIASLLGRTACRITLDDVDFALGGIAFLTVGEFAGERAVVEHAFAAHEIAGFTRGFTRTGRVDRLHDDALRDGRIFFEELGETLVEDRLDDPLDLSVAKLRLG